MDDSDEDFTELCSRLLKRVRRRAGDSGDEKKRRKKNEEEDESSSGPGLASSSSSSRRRRRKDDGQRQVSDGGIGNGVKEQVVRRMQKFRRNSPERLAHVERQATADGDGREADAPDTHETLDVDGDEALALRLQQQLDSEARRMAVTEDGGVFLCQLCGKNLSAMSPQLRTQHINRCLDASEKAPPPRPRVAECPICGQAFRSEKSRSAHLKRCSATLGVSPAELLQALQRQAAERETQPPRQAGDVSESGVDGRTKKKTVKRRAPRVDEDTMVALALSRSLLEQEKERERERKEEETLIQAKLLSSPTTTTAVLQRRAGAGQSRRGKRRKGAAAARPPFLLLSDPKAARDRIQERVSALLLRSRTPSPPPAPTFSPSTLKTRMPSAPLWLKSALLGAEEGGGGGAADPHCEFYTPELGAFIQPWIPPEKRRPAVSESTPVRQRLSPHPQSTAADPECPSPAPPVQPRPSPSPAPSLDAPGTQALQDLVELAEEGMTLSQYAKTESAEADLRLSGFVSRNAASSSPGASSASACRLRRDLGSMVNNPQLSDVQLQVDGGQVYYAHSFMLYARCPLLANVVHDEGFGVQEEGFAPARRVLLGDVPGEAVSALLQYLYTGSCAPTPSLLPHVLQLAGRFDLCDLVQLCEQYSGDEEALDEAAGGAAQEPSLPQSQFLQLLRSMWQRDSDGEREGEGGDDNGGLEENREDEEGGANGDGEIKEDRVDDEELDEIYEFAATQRRTEAAAAQMCAESDEEEEEEEGGVTGDNETKEERPDKEQLDTQTRNMDAPAAETVTKGDEEEEEESEERGGGGGASACMHDEKSSDAALDRSYSRLFSDSWGEYVEPSQTSKLTQTPKRASGRSAAAQRRVSSVGEVIDLSVSPTAGSGEPSETSLPVAGVSPRDQGRVGGQRTLESHSGVSSPSASPPNGDTSKRLPDTPPRPSRPSEPGSPPGPERKQPELIVLSDSDDGTDVGPPSRPDQASNHQASESPKPSQLDQSVGFRGGHRSVLDGSAEVSWLVPATPEASTRCNSTQTHSSGIRRTRLFPASRSSSSFSGGSEASCSSFGRCGSVQPSPTPRSARESAGGVWKSQRHFPLLRNSTSNPVAGPKTHPNSASDPCCSSSTPIRSEPPLKPPDSLQGSPLPAGGQLLCREFETPSGAPPLSPPRYSPSRHRHSIAEKEPSKSSADRDSRLCPKLNDRGSTVTEKETAAETLSGEDEQGGNEDEQKGGRSESRMEEEEENGAEARDGSFFFAHDEPPMAFDDSWGVGGGAVEEQGPCFSLKLDSSDGGDDTDQSGEQKRDSVPLSAPTSLPVRDVYATNATPPLNHSLPDPETWDCWEEDEEEAAALPLSQRLDGVALAKRVAQLRTPVARKKKSDAPLVPITPMPGFSDMDTPELKKRLDRFGVRPLPKKQMVLKLREIHQYTHQLISSEEEEEEEDSSSPRRGRPTTVQPAPASFKRPTAPPPVSPRGLRFGEEEPERDDLPASQDSNTSSTAESDRSNPELCDSDGEGSDGDGVTASQAAARDEDKLLAVRSFIASDPLLYARVLRYQPLSLAELKSGLRGAGIRLATAKLLDFLDSQCITFTTAQPGQKGRARTRVRTRAPGGRGRKRAGVAAPRGASRSTT